MTSADNVFIDSLPYYDDDLAQQPNLQALVDAEIARELKAKPPPNHATDPRLPPERPLFKVRHFAHSCFCLAIFCTITASVISHIHTRKPLPLRHKSIHPLALGFTFLGGSLRPYADLVFFRLLNFDPLSPFNPNLGSPEIAPFLDPPPNNRIILFSQMS